MREKRYQAITFEEAQRQAAMQGGCLKPPPSVPHREALACSRHGDTPDDGCRRCRKVVRKRAKIREVERRKAGGDFGRTDESPPFELRWWRYRQAVMRSSQASYPCIDPRFPAPRHKSNTEGPHGCHWHGHSSQTGETSGEDFLTWQHDWVYLSSRFVAPPPGRGLAISTTSRCKKCGVTEVVTGPG